MDYEKEHTTIMAYEPKEYFKATGGRHEVVFIGEPEPTTFDDGNKIIDQVEVKVSVKQKIMIWTITKGQSFKSLYGQLIAIGSARGKLNGEKITLLVNGENKDKTYVVLEALPIIEKLDLSSSGTLK